ncbi:MAG: hypothetical protein JNK89_06825 [Saprospiraceae bacterium]|nr:hypothetical protein [Saprospiraceae bacterium]
MTTLLKSIFLLFALLCWNLNPLQAQTTDEATGLSVEPSPDIRVLTVYPNPATERLLIEFTAAEAGEELLLRVKNSEGKVVLRRSLITARGGNMVILPVAELLTGQYTLLLDEGRQVRRAYWQKM